MRRVIINCDHCGDEINGDPFTIVKQDTHQLNRFYDPFGIDLCGKCAKKMFDRARAGLIEPSEEVEDILDSLPEIEEEPEEIIESKDGDSDSTKPKKAVSGGNRSKFDTGKLLALNRAGWSPEAIAEELKLTPKQVSSWLYNNKEKVAKFNEK